MRIISTTAAAVTISTTAEFATSREGLSSFQSPEEASSRPTLVQTSKARPTARPPSHSGALLGADQKKVEGKPGAETGAGESR
jgi:hypothetical protein